MTLDEAIKKAEEIAEEKFNNAVYIMDKMKSDVALKNAEECKRFSEEHRQLAEWLKDYKRLKEQEPCEDAISREDALMALTGEWTEPTDELIHRFIKRIKNLPPVTQEPKTGHWIFVDKAHEHAHCSECDYGNVDLLDGRPHNYCPNCGCRMVEPQERSDKDADKKCTYKETGCGSCKRQLDCPIEADKAESEDKE